VGFVYVFIHGGEWDLSWPAWKALFAMEETREKNSKGKAKMKVNAFIAG
jgi:hypothetical protein